MLGRICLWEVLLTTTTTAHANTIANKITDLSFQGPGMTGSTMGDVRICGAQLNDLRVLAPKLQQHVSLLAQKVRRAR